MRWAKILWAYKQQGSKCKQCGHADPRHLVYHHIDESKKVSPIARMFSNKGYTKVDIIAEINKCELLCVYCHKDMHTQGERLAELSDYVKSLVQTMDDYIV